MLFRSAIIVVAGLAATAGIPGVLSADSADTDIPIVASVNSQQSSSDSSQNSSDDSSGDNSRPTLKTSGASSGTDVGSATTGDSGKPAGETVPASPQPQPAKTAPPAQPAANSAAPIAISSEPLQDSSRQAIIRSVHGEFAKAKRALPGKKEGFTIFVGKPIDEQKMSDALRLQGTAIAVAEPVQVTQIDFESKRIVIQLNGGTKKKFHLRDHLQVGMGGPYTRPPDPQGTDHHEGLGAVIVVDFGRNLPDITPDQLESELSPLLDFSKEHSAAVNWVETLPPQFQDAIRDHKALVGMDADMVIAAIGRPDKKVRERNSLGTETEDWIYGNPPARTVFVTFIGEKVTKVEEFD